LVQGRVVERRVMQSGDEAEHGVGHAGQLVIVAQVAWTDHPDARFIHAAFDELLGEDAGLVAWEKGEYGVGTQIPRPLQEWRKIRIEERNPHRLQDLYAPS